MYLYTPPKTPEIDVYYFVIPGQKQTFDDPGFKARIEIDHIEINGNPISIELDILLVDKWGDKWEREILSIQSQVEE